MPSRAVLHAPLVVLPIDSPPFQRLGDFDGDGDLDAVGSRVHEANGQAEIHVWRESTAARGALRQGTVARSSSLGQMVDAVRTAGNQQLESCQACRVGTYPTGDITEEMIRDIEQDRFAAGSCR